MGQGVCNGLVTVIMCSLGADVSVWWLPRTNRDSCSIVRGGRLYLAEDRSGKTFHLRIVNKQEGLAGRPDMFESFVQGTQ